MKKMKECELTVLSRDIDAVIEFLGRRALMQLIGGSDSSHDPAADGVVYRRIRENLEKLSSAAVWLDVPLPAEPEESSSYPGGDEEAFVILLTRRISALKSRENELSEEKQKTEETLNEARAFASLETTFSDLEQVSYLTLRIGRLEREQQDELRRKLLNQVIIVPLGEDDRILAATSRNGRFVLDLELKKAGFVPSVIPEGYKGIPSELLSGLENKIGETARELEDIRLQKEKFRQEYGAKLRSVTASYLMADMAEQLKARTAVTEHVYFLSGWVPADKVRVLVEGLEKLTEGRVAVRTYKPEELGRVKDGREKVPVSLDHGIFTRSFRSLVFSYGAPLYGTIDPTPLVAFFFTILFGVMFGDLGQGLVLFSFGFLTGKHGPAFLSGLRKFSGPLMAVGIASMIMGCLNGEFFTNAKILNGPTRALTGFLTGRPVDRILVIMPLPEKGGSVNQLFYFFGFTISLGVLLNLIGLIVNTINHFLQKKYENALFGKSGLAGILLFCYALFIALRFGASMLKPERFYFDFHWFDMAVLTIPLLGIFMGSALWRLVSGERPVFAKGFAVFITEGFVETLEAVSTQISNTVSFLRVGAFALAHAVLAYIVFRFSEEVSEVAAGTALSFLIMIFGNLVVIFLKGLIVAIQVVRLQYYEFFSKFFTETGVVFSPFRFRQERSES